MPAAAVVTERRPAPPSLTELPEVLERYLVAQGKRWSWQPSTREALSMLYRRGIRPVRVADIEDEAVRKELEDAALFVNDAGYFQLFDAVLCVQSMDAHEADQHRKSLTLNPEQQAEAEINSLEANLQELFAKTGRHHGAPILQGEVPTLAAQVLNRPASGAPGVRVVG